MANRSAGDVRNVLFITLYRRVHNVAGPADVVAIAKDYDVIFLPPVSAKRGGTDNPTNPIQGER